MEKNDLKMPGFSGLFSALSLSGLIALEIETFMAGLSSLLPEGLWRMLACGLTGAAVFGFFIWFFLHACRVEWQIQYENGEEGTG